MRLTGLPRGLWFNVVIAAANYGYGTEAELPTCATEQRGTTVKEEESPQDSPCVADSTSKEAFWGSRLTIDAARLLID